MISLPQKILAKYKIIIRILLLITSFLYQLIVYLSVVDRQVDNFTLLFWAISIMLLYFSFPVNHPVKEKPKKDLFNRKRIHYAFLLIFLAISLRVSLMFNTNSFHIDEYLTAHFSYSLGDISKLDWFGVFPPKGVWIVQFPVFYFFFQKIFFNLFGVSSLIMRFSVVPYIVLIFTATYLITKRLYSEQAAIFSIIILAFLAPELYLSRWALHFISSTALFLIATYFFILSYKLSKKIYFAFFGFFLGLCYTTYYASYLAAPILFIFFLGLAINRKIKSQHFLGFLLSSLVFAYTVSPFVTYALRVDNFFTQRTQQVKLINGLWSPYKDVDVNTASVKEILVKQSQLALKSLYTDGIGGNGGYIFGKIALFDKPTFAFLLVSLVYALYKIARKGDAKSILLLATIFITFVTGVILTTPPPAFHRFSLAFPFIAVLISTTISDIYFFLQKKRPNLAFWISGFMISIILVSNIFHFKKILVKDGPDDPDFPKIENELVKNNQKMVYIAAFSSYSLGKVLYIRSEGKLNSLTMPLDEMLVKIPNNKISYLVVLYPEEEMITKITNSFTEVTTVDRYNTHLLLRVKK